MFGQARRTLIGITAGLTLAAGWYVHRRRSEPAEWLARHHTVAERVLIIRNPAVVDDPDFDSDPPSGPATGEWSFASILRTAFSQVGARDQDVKGFIDQWRMNLESSLPAMFTRFGAAWKERDTNYALNRAPVRLLAVANRIDLAKVDPDGCRSDGQTGELRGAEIRFLFAALPIPIAPHYLSLTIEFVLPCVTRDQYQQLAYDWSKLEALDWSPAKRTYQVQLQDLLRLETGQARTVHLRMNLDSLGTWDAREFTFRPDGLVAQNLERQPGVRLGDCQTRNSLLGEFIAHNAIGIMGARYQLPGTLSVNAATINPRLQAVLTLGPDVAKTKRREALRTSLSLNSCTGCHGAETATDFHQVGQRGRNEVSPLSGFLSGSSTCAAGQDPSTTTYCTVHPPVLPKCDAPAPARRYNDLLRRHQFLRAVLHLKAAADIATWRRTLDPFEVSIPR